VQALRVSMVQHVETKIQLAIRVNVLMDILVINVILEVSLFVNIYKLGFEYFQIKPSKT
jgi:hypothetical protein